MGNLLHFRPDGSKPTAVYNASELKSFQLGTVRYVSRVASSEEGASPTFLRQLVAGHVSLYIYERRDGVEVFLLEKNGQLLAINPTSPAQTLATLSGCSQMNPDEFNGPLSITAPRLTRYVLAYNRCVKPAELVTVYGTRPSRISISLEPRLYLPLSYYRLQYTNGMLSDPSTMSAKPGLGLSFIMNWGGRFSGGLDLIYMNRVGAWNLDPTAKEVWIVDQFSSRSLSISPTLRYEFRHTDDQSIVPYLSASLIFSKLLAGELMLNPSYPFRSGSVAINSEASINELGGALGGGIAFRITPRMDVLLETKLAHTAAVLSVYTLPYPSGFGGGGPKIAPRSYRLDTAVGLRLRL